MTEHVNRFVGYSTHELGIQPEAYEMKLDVDVAPLCEQYAAAAGIGKAALEGFLVRLPGELPQRGVPVCGIVAAVRDPAKAADLAERGVEVREADYDRPAGPRPWHAS
ncbi:hypothetical protein [Streptomyces milbemycinicus]|uniref:Uncharacterized protein n=1 Tax=Streptomyces milbemycinicus TaxID=476552 RepID=A0ABW8LZX8_9ACTN